MIQLNKSIEQWHTERFKTTLKQELEALPRGSLPLHQATQCGGQADDSNIAVLVNSVLAESDLAGEAIQVQIGVFFDEILGGCSCGDEPPRNNTYCEMRVSIDKTSGHAVFRVMP